MIRALLKHLAAALLRRIAGELPSCPECAAEQSESTHGGWW